jgi:hypothetical protein
MATLASMRDAFGGNEVNGTSFNSETQRLGGVTTGLAVTFFL